jgi:dTDP-4-dehydrorhamnose reductase
VRLLLTGASGFFGQAFARAAAPACDLTAVYYTNPAKITAGHPLALDLKDAAGVRRALADLQPHVIVHAAASNRDEQNQLAILPAAQSLAAYTGRAGARLIHFSSDMVFSGAAAPYGDDDPPDSALPYGRHKAEAEAAVAALDPRALIVRPSLIYGFDPWDAQTTWLVRAVENNTPVRLFTDEIRCPVWVHDLTEAILEVSVGAGRELSGRMNLGGPQPLNRWDFGRKMLAALGLAPGPNVQPATIAESGLARPTNLTLRSARASALRARLRSVDEAVQAHRQAARHTSRPEDPIRQSAPRRAG